MERRFDALIKTLGIAEKLDFDSVKFYSHLGYVEYGDGDELFGIVTHLDVVPAGDGWTVPPFAGTVRTEAFMAAIDDKRPGGRSPVCAFRNQENCISLNKRVRIIFGCDERERMVGYGFFTNQTGRNPQYGYFAGCGISIINAEKGLLQLRAVKGISRRGETALPWNPLQAGVSA